MNKYVSSLAACVLGALPAGAQLPTWAVQLGSSGPEAALTTTPDGAGGVFVGGQTSGGLSGPLTGMRGAWFARYDASGAQAWLRQLSSSGADETWTTRADGSGGLFVGGSTSGHLFGANAGLTDAWLARYDGAGNPLWARQFGTSGDERAQGSAPDGSGGLYLSGLTSGALGGANAGGQDGWVARFDGAGNQLWMLQIGTSGLDNVLVLEPDPAGGVFLGGCTTGSLAEPSAGGIDAWCARVDSAGQLTWVHQFGTGEWDCAYGMAPDAAGGFFLTMTTDGSLGGPSSGSFDGCLARYTGAGKRLWIRQMGTASQDLAFGAVGDGLGGVYISGSTSGSFGGPSAGQLDAWVAHYDAAGTQLSVRQFGSPASEIAFAAAADDAGGLFLCGDTYGDIGAANVGSTDAWLARVADNCEQVTKYCTASLTSIRGCQAILTAQGAPSLGDPRAFTIAAGNVPGGGLGLCIVGANGPAGLPTGSLGGQVCVQPPFYRSAIQAGGGSAGSCNGSFEFSLQDLIDSSPIVTVGAVLNVQIWARDPANPDGFLLSDGAQLSVCP